MTDLMVPRGIRNNNPGNIRFDGTLWRGLAGDDGTFCKFTDPIYGIRAIARILKHYQADGICTIKQIIHRWAPPIENNTPSYVSAVANHCALSPDVAVTPSDYPRIIEGIIQHENGQQPYTPEQIAAGITAAL